MVSCTFIAKRRGLYDRIYVQIVEPPLNVSPNLRIYYKHTATNFSARAHADSPTKHINTIKTSLRRKQQIINTRISAESDKPSSDY